MPLILNEQGISPYRLARVTELDQGAHNPPSRGNRDYKMCVMEAVSWVCDLPWGDSPRCVDDSLMGFGIYINDNAPELVRQEMIPLVPKMVGTADEPIDIKRKRVVILYERLRNEFTGKALHIALEDKLIGPAMMDWYNTNFVHQHDDDAMNEARRKQVQLRRELDRLSESERFTNIASFPQRSHEISGELDFLEVMMRQTVGPDRLITPRFSVSHEFNNLIGLVDGHTFPTDDVWPSVVTLYDDLLEVRA